MTRHRRDAYDTLHAATFMLTLLKRLSLLPFAFLLLPFPCPLRHLTRPCGKTINLSGVREVLAKAVETKK